MKRWYFGMGLLAVLLLGSLPVTRNMTDGMEQVSNSLTAAANNALVGNWEVVESLTESASSRWEENRSFTTAFADHSPLEDIEADLAQLKIYLRARDQEAYAATAARLAKKMEAVGQAHTLSWQNIL